MSIAAKCTCGQNPYYCNGRGNCPTAIMSIPESPTSLSDKPVVGKSKEEMLKKYLRDVYDNDYEMEDNMCNHYEAIYKAMQAYADQLSSAPVIIELKKSIIQLLQDYSKPIPSSRSYEERVVFDSDFDAIANIILSNIKIR